MPGIIDVAKSAKEASGYVAMSIGAGMTMGQLIGYIIGFCGIIIAMLRWYEARRANNIKIKADEFQQQLQIEKWEFEKNAKSKNVSKTEGK